MDAARLPFWVVSVGVSLVLCSGGPCPVQAQPASGRTDAVTLRGKVLDAETGRLLAARLYVQDQAGRWFTVRSASPDGRAIPYRKVRGRQSVEVHTSLSAHPFEANLPPGRYTLTAERGKEWVPASVSVELTKEPAEVTLRLRRLTDLSAQGWFSGETHVHRSVDELPTLLQSEDLNVAFPLTYWVRRSDAVPASAAQPPAGPPLVQVDSTHVFWQTNTEYEINWVAGRRYTLGAFFALGHRQPLALPAPPVQPVAQQIHSDGGLLELDKHNWPWSAMLVPVARVDLYELANNHMWRCPFYFAKFGEPPAEFMHVETNQRGLTERGWVQFTFQNYYTLLNCGFRLAPTAGTASGVHPVPLGFGRVYVHVDGSFSYDKWFRGLREGRSFVTTGPLLLACLNGRLPGTRFELADGRRTPRSWKVSGELWSCRPVQRLEVVVNGRVVQSVEPENGPSERGGFRSEWSVRLEPPDVPTDRSFWCAVRCFEQTEAGGVRFAHTAPWFVDVASRPVRPRRSEVQYLVERVQSQLSRGKDVLPQSALDEYRRALVVYQELLKQSVSD